LREDKDPRVFEKVFGSASLIKKETDMALADSIIVLVKAGPLNEGFKNR